MNLRIFNAAMVIGWLLILAGGMLVHPGYGLLIGGAVLLGLTLFCARMAGVYEPPKTEPVGPEGD